MDLSRMTGGLLLCFALLLTQAWGTEELAEAVEGLPTPTWRTTATARGERLGYQTVAAAYLDSLAVAHRRPEGGAEEEAEEDALRTSGRPRRRGRAGRPQPVHDPRGVYRLTAVEPLYPLCGHVRHVSVLSWKGDTYALCASAQGSASLGRLTSSGWVSLRSWAERRAAQSLLFHFNDVLYALVADSSRANGTDLLRWNPNREQMEVDHTIHSRFATAVVVWKMNVDEGNFHLALANSKGPAAPVSADHTYTYDWRGTYFDHYDSVRSFEVRDLEAFHIYGQAYLAVANHRADDHDFHVDSEIFRFDLGDWRWRSVQKIRTRAATDIQFFQMGPDTAREFFLAVANQFQIVEGQRDYAVESVIYKFVSGRFVVFQCLPTQGATSLSAFADAPSGAFLLAVASLQAPVRLYQYDGWRFVPAPVQGSGETMGPGALALAFYTLPDPQEDGRRRTALVISNPQKERAVSVFALTFVRASPLREWRLQAGRWCARGHRRLNDTLIPELADTMTKAYFVDQSEPIVIQGPVEFSQGLTVSGALFAHKVTNAATGAILDHALLQQLQDMEVQLHLARERTERAKHTLARALKITGPQTITGQYEFSSLSCSCSSTGCHVQHVQTVHLNQANVTGLPSKVLFLHQPNHVLGRLNLESLRVEGDLLVQGFVSGVNTSHVVTRTSHWKILAQKTFEHTIATSSILVQGALDGVHVSPETVLLTEGDQLVEGQVTMTEVVVQDMEVDGTVNGVNLRQFYQDTVLVDGGVTQLVTGPKILRGSHTFEKLHLDTGRINGVDVVDLWKHAVWLDGEQTLHGAANFSVLSLAQPTVAHINGLRVPGPEVVTPGSGALQVSAHQRFLGDLVIEHLDVEESINGLGRVPGKDTDCPNQLNILLRSCAQTLTGSNTFVSILLGGKNQVVGKLNDFSLADLEKHLQHRAQNLTGDWVFNQVELRAPVLVREDLRGWEAEEIYRKALKLGQPFHQETKVVFANHLQVERLLCPDLNGVRVERDLLLRRGNGAVTGVKHWEHVLLLDDAQVAGTVNALNINFLANTLLSGPHQQVLQGHRVIQGDLVVNELDLGGRLSGLDLSRLVPLSAEVTFQRPQVLENVRMTKGLSASSLSVLGGRVNGVDFGRALNDTLLYNLPQKISGRKTLTGHVSVPSDSDLKVGLVNGLSLSSLALDTVYRDVPQQVTGRKTFGSPAYFRHLLMNGSVNGVDVWEVFNDWMLQGAPQTVSGDLVFNQGLAVDGNLQVRGLLNRVDVGALPEDVVNLRESFQITGDLVLGSAEVLGDVALTGKVQGVDLSEEAVLKSADNVVGGRKRFGHILVEGDLAVEGQIGGLDVAALCGLTARRTTDLFLERAAVRGSVRISGDLVTGGDVNGVQLEPFSRSVVFVNGSIDFPDVVFRELVILQDLTLLGNLNGANVANLQADYMSLTRDQEVASRMTFGAPIVCESVLHVERLVTAGGMIGDVNITEFARTVLTTVGQQVITAKYIVQKNIYFDQNLQVQSPVSGVRVPEDLALKTRDNVISGPLVFARDLVVTSELTLSEGAALQGVDVSLWVQNAVLATGAFTLTGHKTFRQLQLRDVVAVGLLGGANVSSSAVLLSSGSQMFTGKVLFDHSLRVEGSLEATGEVNGVNIPRLLQDSVLKGQASVVSGRKTFLSPLTVSRLSVAGLVAGVNMTELSVLSHRPYDLQALERDLQGNGRRLQTFDHFLSNGATALGYYREWFRWPSDWTEVLAWDYTQAAGSSEGLLVVSRRMPAGPAGPACSKTTLYKVHDQGVLEGTEVASGLAVSVKTFSFAGTSFLVTSSLDNLCHPTAGGSRVFALDPAVGAFLQRQELSSGSSTDAAVLLPPDSAPCLASAVPDRILVHCLDEETQQFQLRQELDVFGVLTVTSSGCREGLFLSALAFQDGGWALHLFRWDALLRPFQRLPSAALPLAAPLLLPRTEVDGRTLCLLVTPEGASPEEEYSRPSAVYRYDDASGQFLMFQQLDIGGVVSADWSPLSSGHLLLTFLTSDTVHTLMWRGQAGFTAYDQVPFHGGRKLLSFARAGGSGGSAWQHLALSGSLCARHWWQNEANAAFILKARVKGT